MKYRLFLLTPVLCVLLFALLGPSVSYAIVVPTSLDLYPEVHVFRHCIDTDDALILVKYNINYGAPPSETATGAFVFKFLNGTTLEGIAAPYSYQNSGYDDGIVALYLDVTEAADVIANWQAGTFVATLEGNPSLTWTGGSLPTASLSGSDVEWHATTSHEYTAVALRLQILEWAQELTVSWGVGYTLTAGSGASMRLSTQGENYFTNSIVDLYHMAPNLFSGVVTSPEVYRDTHTRAYAGQLSDVTDPDNVWFGTTYADNFNTLAAAVHVPTLVARSAFFFILVAIAMFYIVQAVGPTGPALLLITPMLLMGALWGFVPLVLIAVLGFFAVISLGYVLFYRGTG